MEVPRLMEVVLIPLAFLGLCGGLLNLPDYMGGGWLGRFFGVEAATISHGPELVLQATAGVLALAGLALVHCLYGGSRRVVRLTAAEEAPGALLTFLLKGWRLDDLYRFLFIRPYEWLARILWERLDEGVIDDSLDLLAGFLGWTGQTAGRWTCGRVSVYLLSLAAGLVVILVSLVWVAWW